MFLKSLPTQLFQKRSLSLRGGTLHGKGAHNLHQVCALLITSSEYGTGTKVST